MHLTQHAGRRSRQRSIPPFLLRLLLDHGAREYDHQGAIICFFDKRARRRVESEVGRAFFRRLDPHLFDVYLVLSNDGDVVTVGYRTQRIQRGARPQGVLPDHMRRARRPVRVLPPPAVALQAF